MQRTSQQAKNYNNRLCIIQTFPARTIFGWTFVGERISVGRSDMLWYLELADLISGFLFLIVGKRINVGKSYMISGSSYQAPGWHNWSLQLSALRVFLFAVGKRIHVGRSDMIFGASYWAPDGWLQWSLQLIYCKHCRASISCISSISAKGLMLAGAIWYLELGLISGYWWLAAVAWGHAIIISAYCNFLLKRENR